MKTKQKIAVPILADREVFDYLKEKVGERKTKTEAFCDLLDKSLAGFVSPFLRNKGYELQPNQCHVTVSDLSSEWHWHRATVRSFLDVMEEFGLLNRIRLSKKRHHYHDCANQPIHGVLQWTEEVEPCRTAT